MGSEWKEKYLVDCLEKLIDYRGKTPKKAENGILTLSAKSVKNGTIDYSKAYYISRETYDKFMTRGFPQKGDILMTTEAPLGYVAKLDRDDVAIAQRLLVLRGNSNKLDNSYLLYYLKSVRGQHELLSRATGTTVQGIKRSEFEKVKIVLPSISEQKAIAYILGTLDEKIELNRRMNATLEQMAQAMFKSWFVDFDPVIDKALAAGNSIPEPLQKRTEKRKALGDKRKPLPEDIQKLFPDEFEFSEELDKWVPKGWEVCSFQKIADVKYGKDHKNLSDGLIPVYGSGGIMRYANKSLYKGESILIPRKGTLSNLLYVNEEFWSVDTMFYTIPKKEKIAKYLYYNLKMLDFINMNVGSAVPSMTTKVLNSLIFLLPPQRIMERFDDFINVYYLKITAHKNQINKLTVLRDTLLPKLISGEIRIPEAHQILRTGANIDITAEERANY